MAAGNQVVLGKYEIGRLLGKGSFAKVYHAKKLSTGENVAVKVISKDEVRKQGMQNQIQREISIMRLVRHPHIVNLIEVMATKSKIFVVMEYVRGGEVFTRVAEGKLAEDEARKYFQQLISAVEFCHARGVYHRDLKPENLLLDADGTLKVSDFGLSAFTDQLWLDGLLHTQCGTPAYVAPEVLRKHGYDGAKADIWSCGIVLFVFLTGFLPFQDENVMRMYSKMFKNEFQFPRWISLDARRLISKLLIADPQRRITISAIKRDVWFVKGFRSPPSFDEVDSDHGGVLLNDKRDKPSSPSFFNAFELISSISSGFDLSGLFESETRNRMMFTSRSSSDMVMARIEVAAKRKEFGTAKLGDGKLRLTSSRQGTKVPLTLTAEVFDVAPDVTVVELSKVAGDTCEYLMFCEEEDVRQTMTGLD